MTVVQSTKGHRMEYILTPEECYLPAFVEGTEGLHAEPRGDTGLTCLQAPHHFLALMWHGNALCGELPILRDDWHFMFSLRFQHVGMMSAVAINDQPTTDATIYRLYDGLFGSEPPLHFTADLLRAYWLSQDVHPQVMLAQRIKPARIIGQVAPGVMSGQLELPGGWIYVSPGLYIVSELDGSGVRTMDARSLALEFETLHHNGQLISTLPRPIDPFPWPVNFDLTKD